MSDVDVDDIAPVRVRTIKGKNNEKVEISNESMTEKEGPVDDRIDIRQRGSLRQKKSSSKDKRRKKKRHSSKEKQQFFNWVSNTCKSCWSKKWFLYERRMLLLMEFKKILPNTYAFFDNCIVILTSLLMENLTKKPSNLVIYWTIFLSCVIELFPQSPKYNFITLLALVITVKFPFDKFISKNSHEVVTIRPQILVSCFIIFTIFLDCKYLLLGEYPVMVMVFVRAVIILCICSKCIFIYEFLVTNRNESYRRARKYLFRRMRIFMLPLGPEPRRLMRDVRARILALGILHLFLGFMYLLFFGLSLTVISYIGFVFAATSLNISTFLAFKTLTSLAVLTGIWYDTDTVLTLGYFGLMGFCMKYLKKYVKNKRKQLGGWPYPYYFNKTRFAVVTGLKVVDVLIGIVGWFMLDEVYGTSAWRETSVRWFLGFLYFLFLLGDFWSSLLFIGVHYLLSKVEIKLANEELELSDDSEIDEFGIRKFVLMKSKSDDSDVSNASLESGDSDDSGDSDPDDQSHLLAGDYHPSSDKNHRKQVEIGPPKRENQFLSSRQFAKIVENV